MENKWRSIVDQRRWDADWNTSRVGFSWRERQFALLHIVEMGGKVKSESESCSVMSDSLRPHGLYSPWNSPGRNTVVASLSLLQGLSLAPSLLMVTTPLPICVMALTVDSTILKGIVFVELSPYVKHYSDTNRLFHLRPLRSPWGRE